MDEQPNFRVMIVDDHAVVRAGLRCLPRFEPRITIVAEACTAAEARILVPQIHPDVVILDLKLPDGNGIELCASIKANLPKIKVLIYSGSVDESHVLAAIQAGADGYFLKSGETSHLVAGIDTVMQGGTCFNGIGDSESENPP